MMVLRSLVIIFQLTMSDNILYKCVIDDKKFPCIDDLTKHLITTHCAQLREYQCLPEYCVVCNRGFASKGDLGMHVATNVHHRTQAVARGEAPEFTGSESRDPSVLTESHFVSLDTPGVEDQAMFLEYAARKEKEREKKKGKKRAKVQLKCFCDDLFSCVSLRINS